MSKLPEYLVLEVQLLCLHAIQSSTIVNVYWEAGRLRRRFPHANIAVESMVEECSRSARTGRGLSLMSLQLAAHLWDLKARSTKSPIDSKYAACRRK